MRAGDGSWGQLGRSGWSPPPPAAACLPPTVSRPPLLLPLPDRNQKRLLDGVSGQVGPGFTAIMGALQGGGSAPTLDAWPAGLARNRRAAAQGATNSPSLPPPPSLPPSTGPSGAGKSTLLNALACRMDKGAVMEGRARLNGADYGLPHLKRLARWASRLLLGCCCCCFCLGRWGRRLFWLRCWELQVDRVPSVDHR